jgi:two-component system nitrate/nitrite response regulator NarL
VKVHVKAILRKIRVRNRTQAAMWAMSHSSCIGHTDGGRYPAMEGAPLPLGPRQASLSRLAEGQAVDPAMKATSPT